MSRWPLKLVSRFVEAFYPDAVIYGNDFGKDLTAGFDEDIAASIPRKDASIFVTALMAICSGANTVLQPGGSLSATFGDLYYGSKETGSYRITVERLRE